jgi:small neutral amino acid transporter SnatA (MarC family)
VKEYGRLVVSMAAILALMLCLLVLWFSNYFTRFIGNYGIGTTSRVIGIFLVAIAVELILRGLVSRLAELRVEGIFS